jgi:outer membrane receptor for ferric coprogen and ferric-rhodotorulic acid
LKALNFHGELAIYSGEKWKANIRGDYYQYTEGNEVHAWHQPSLKFTASGQYKLKDKFTVSMDLFYVGSRWAKSLVPVQDVEREPDGSYHFKLNGYTDANIMVEYRYNKRLSAWVQMNNAFALKYQRWSAYNNQQFLGIMGVTYAF